VLLAILGDHWMGMETGNGKRRIDAPRDHVRLELELALSRNIPVIPALIRKASIPLKMRCHHRCALLHIVTAFSFSRPGFSRGYWSTHQRHWDAFEP